MYGITQHALQAAAMDKARQLLGDGAQADALSALPVDGRAGVTAQRKAMEACDAQASPVVAFVSKMVAVPAAALPRGARTPHNAGAEVFLGFGRVFSGTLRDGDPVQVLSAAYAPDGTPGSARARQLATVQGLYLMMGRGLESLEVCFCVNLSKSSGLMGINVSFSYRRAFQRATSWPLAASTPPS